MTKIQKANQVFNKQFRAKFSHENIKQGLITIKNKDIETNDNKSLGSDEAVDLVRDVVFEG